MCSTSRSSAARLEDVTRTVSQVRPISQSGRRLLRCEHGRGCRALRRGGPAFKVAAVVLRGGRPDLAGPHLGSVGAPTLLIVGGRDPLVLELNQTAQRQLHCESDLVVVPGPHISSRSPARSRPPPAGQGLVHRPLLTMAGSQITAARTSSMASAQPMMSICSALPSATQRTRMPPTIGSPSAAPSAAP